MDAKITKTRLAQMLSYDWLKVIGGALAVIFVWLLVFTWTATRITNTQKFIVMNYFGVSLGEEYYNDYEDFVKGKVFSYEIFELENVDINQDETVGYQLLETRWAVGEGDFLVMADILDTSNYYDKDGNSLNEVDENTDYVHKSYLEVFSRSVYFSNVSRLDDAEGKEGFFTQMKRYLSNFYAISSEREAVYGGKTFTVADFDESSLNEERVKELFRARAEKNKDKRYKKEAEWEKGYADEIARIKSYQTAYEEFFSYLDAGYLSLTAWEYEKTEHQNAKFESGGVYSVNLCPKEDTMGEVKKDFYYRQQTEDGKYLTSAKNINALFLELEDLDHDFKYENILLVNEIVKRYCSEL